MVHGCKPTLVGEDNLFSKSIARKERRMGWKIVAIKVQDLQ